MGGDKLTVAAHGNMRRRPFGSPRRRGHRIARHYSSRRGEPAEGAIAPGDDQVLPIGRICQARKATPAKRPVWEKLHNLLAIPSPKTPLAYFTLAVRGASRGGRQLKPARGEGQSVNRTF